MRMALNLIRRTVVVGKVFERDSAEFNALIQSTFTPNADDEYDFPTPEFLPGARAIIWIDITMVGLSSGYSVPIMEFVTHRECHGSSAYISVLIRCTGDQLTKYFQRLEDKDASVDDPYTLHYESSFRNYMVTMNSWSIDGLPGLKFSNNRASDELVRNTMVEAGLGPPVRLRQDQDEAKRLYRYHPVWMFAWGVSIGVVATVLARDRKALSSLLPAYLSH